jgi:hypothetical protein
MENYKIKNNIFFEAGGKREAGGDDKLTIFFMGPNSNSNALNDMYLHNTAAA